MIVDTYFPIKDLEIDKVYTQKFLVSEVIDKPNMKDSNRVRFARLVLKDVTGTIEGVVWNYEPNSIVAGQYILATIHIKLYKSKLEFQTRQSDIEQLDAIPVNLSDYENHISLFEQNAALETVESKCMSLDDSEYRDIMCYAINNHNLLILLKNSQYETLSYAGGLLMHIVKTLTIAECIANQSNSKVNTSLVYSGCILRNLGWSSPDRYHELCTIHELSMHEILKIIEGCESSLGINIPIAKRLTLLDVCHSIDTISTLEGKIIAYADNAAKMLELNDSIINKKKTGDWSESLFVGHIE